MAESLHYHDVEVSLDNGAFQLWDAFAFQELQQLSLVKNLRVSCPVRFLSVNSGSYNF